MLFRLMLLLLLQTESEFAKAYAAGIHKSRYWEPFYEDTLNLLAKLPTIAAMIYRRTYKGGKYIEAGEHLALWLAWQQMPFLKAYGRAMLSPACPMSDVECLGS